MRNNKTFTIGVTGSPINVLLVSPFFYPHIGGSQRYMEELYAHMMARHPNVKVTVLAYNTDHAPARESWRGMTIYRIPCYHVLPGQFALPKPLSLIGALITLSQKRFDYVHTHLRFFDACWWGWLYAKFIGAKSVFTEHVATHPVHPNRFVRGVAKFVDFTIGRFAVSMNDAVTATNAFAARFLTGTLKIGKHVDVSYGGVDTSQFKPARTGSVKRIPKIGKLPKNAVVITYAGRIIWSKGVTYLMKAIAQMHEALPKHVVFVIAGTGDLADWLRQTIAKQHLEKRVLYTGPLSAAEMRTLLASSDVFVHASHHNEGFPNVILEAGASGCAMIATNNAGTGEILEHGTTALFIKPKSATAIRDAITWMLGHPKERIRMAAACREHIVKHFDWSIVAETFYRVVHRACHFGGLIR